MTDESQGVVGAAEDVDGAEAESEVDDEADSEVDDVADAAAVAEAGGSDEEQRVGEMYGHGAASWIFSAKLEEMAAVSYFFDTSLRLHQMGAHPETVLQL